MQTNDMSPPDAAVPMPTLTLKPDKLQSVRRRHPWVFSGAVALETGEPRDGDLVRLLETGGGTLGTAHYQAAGSIRARILAFGEEPVDAGFWARRLAAAAALRERLGLAAPDVADNAFRLVHGEGDSLPGLIVDIYARAAVLQPHTTGMSRALPAIEAALRHALPGRVATVYAHDPTDGKFTLLSGPPADSVTIVEDGLRFVADLAHGQKTGFFLDQREHRALVRRLAADRRVLNAFSYTGGFSVHALAGGAAHVTSVDSSRAAIDAIGANLAANGLDPARHRGIVADAMRFIRRLDDAYDLIVLDPPAFAKRLAARHQAIQAYRRLNEAAIRQVRPAGLLLTFSCSQAVTPDMFRGAVLAAAIDADRPVRILRQLHQPEDHPIGLYHPEGEYLKGLLLAVD